MSSLQTQSMELVKWTPRSSHRWTEAKGLPPPHTAGQAAVYTPAYKGELGSSLLALSVHSLRKKFLLTLACITMEEGPSRAKAPGTGQRTLEESKELTQYLSKP